MNEPQTPPPPSPPSAPAQAQAPRRRALRFAVWGAAGVAVLAVVYVGIWFAMALGLGSAVNDWLEARRDEGYVASYFRIELGGFPLHLRATLDEAALGRPHGSLPWNWEATRAVVEARPWLPGHVRVLLIGPQRVRLGAGDETLELFGNARLASVDLAPAAGGAWQAKMNVKALNVVGADGRPVTTLGEARLRLKAGPAAVADYRTVTWDMTLAASDLGLPEDLALPLGPAVAGIEVEASIMGLMPPGPLVPALAAWRDAGGTIEVTRFRLAYGPLGLSADGTAALDSELQPIGAFTAKAEGVFALVDALVARGLIRRREAVNAKVVLGALVRREGGGTSTLSVPVTIQDGVLYAGPVMLARVPPVTWPGAAP